MNNYFTLFSLPTHYDITLSELHKAYLKLQTQQHPDNFVKADKEAQQKSLKMASLINEGYQVLKNPLLRATHFIQLHSSNLPPKSVSTIFLMRQMEWQETLSDIKQDRQALQKFKQEILTEQETSYQMLNEYFDRQAWQEADLVVQELQFLAKLIKDIDQTISQLAS